MIIESGPVRLIDEAGELLGQSETHGGWLLPLGPEVSIVDPGPPLVIKLKARPERDQDDDSDALGGLADVPVGSLPIITRDPRTGDVVVNFIDLPPPRGLTQDGIDQMWRALSDLPPAARASVRRAALWESGRSLRLSEIAVDLPTFPNLLGITTHLLHNWPRKETATTSWRPLGVSGGVEDVIGTVRRLHTIPVALHSGRTLPSRTLRRHGDTVPWTTRAVSDMALTVSNRIRQSPKLVGMDIGSLLAPLNALSERARAPRGVAEVSPSSWPPPLRDWMRVASQVLSEVEATRARKGHAPLCQMHELYESWVSSEFLNAAKARFGEPLEDSVLTGDARYGKPTFYTRWMTERGLFEIWVQAAFSETAQPLDGKVVSVTSELIPDVVISGPKGLIGIDAKFTSRPQVTSPVVSATGSKYLWGLRNSTDSTQALQWLHIMTNSKPIQPFSEKSLITTHTAVPGDTAAVWNVISRAYD